VLEDLAVESNIKEAFIAAARIHTRGAFGIGREMPAINPSA